MQSVRHFLKLIIKGYLRDFFWNVYGKKFHSGNLPLKADSFLFICKGNICRSAFAHYLTEKISVAQGNTIASAGIEVVRPEPSPDDAVEAAKAFGISLQAHHSMPINLVQCQKADMVLVMEAWQLVKVRKRFPEFKDRVYLLSQFEDDHDRHYNGWDKYNILDPYGKGQDAFQQCFQRIERCIQGLLRQASRN